MKVVHSLEDFKSNGPVILTQGTFDGIHFGHQKILNRVVNLAKEQGGESVLLTFYPHPRMVLYPNDHSLKLITTLDERIERLESLGIDQLVVLQFTKELSRLSPMEYVRNILVDTFNVSTFIIGYDHRFGRNREGSMEDLTTFAETYNFSLEQISRQDIEELAVSSSKIRQALLDGNLNLAHKYLGWNYSLNAKVVKGKGIGKSLGFPTANLELINKHKLIPANGVYAVRVKHQHTWYDGMLNIGNNPTIEGAEWSIEVNIFDFNSEIYEQQLELEFVQRMRDELKFAQLSDLIEQLNKDQAEARLLLQT